MIVSRYFAAVAATVIATALPVPAAVRPAPDRQADTRAAEHDLPPLSGVPNSDAPRPYHATWAIIIGVASYEKLSSADFQVNDAAAVREKLCNDYGFLPDHVLYLTEAEATKAKIEAAFECWLPCQDIRPNDALLVFFAGHGQWDDASGQGYVAGLDAKPGLYRTTWVRVSTLRDGIAATACKHKLLLLNSCFSGSLFQERPSAYDILNSPAGATGRTRRPGA